MWTAKVGAFDSPTKKNQFLLPLFFITPSKSTLSQKPPRPPNPAPDPRKKKKSRQKRDFFFYISFIYELFFTVLAPLECTSEMIPAPL
jgi:hypothetical protein